MKLRNIKTKVVKDVEDKIVADYLSTKEWENLDEKEDVEKTPKTHKQA